MDNKKFYKILDKIEKPARYVGKEKNSVVKNKDEVDIRFAFSFPDRYEPFRTADFVQSDKRTSICVV